MSEQKIENECLGCAEPTEAEYVWHDGLWTSYVCAEHARKQLPREGRDDYRVTVLENNGRESIVAGYATPIGGGEKVVWAEEVDA